MRVLLFLFVFSFSSLCEARKVVVLDLDETLCWHTKDAELANKISEKYPEMTRIEGLAVQPTAVYFFPEHTEYFLRFLLKNDFEIKIFSAGSERRNKELVKRYLEYHFDFDECAAFDRTGQFEIFSYRRLVRALPKDLLVTGVQLDDRTTNSGLIHVFGKKQIKSLRSILPGRDLGDIILIDDILLNGLAYHVETISQYVLTDAEGVQHLCPADIPGATQVILKQIVHEDRAELTMIRPETHMKFLEKIVEEVDDEENTFLAHILASPLYYTGVLAMAIDMIEQEQLSLRDAVQELLYPGKTVQQIDLADSFVSDPDFNPHFLDFLERGGAEIGTLIEADTLEEWDEDDCLEDSFEDGHIGAELPQEAEVTVHS